MLATLLLTTLALLMLFIVGLFLPEKVFLGPRASRRRALLAYGVPGFVGFVMTMALAPSEKVAPVKETAKEQRPARSQEHFGLPSVSFQGMTLPGTMSDAKASGFTDCRASTVNYECKSGAPVQLLGLTAESATLDLDGKNHFQDPDFVRHDAGGDVRMLPAEALAYGSVRLEFPTSVYDRSCLRQHVEKTQGEYRPHSCIVNENSIDRLNDALLKAGWLRIEGEEPGRASYFHPRELVEIAFSSGSVKIERVSPDTVKQGLARSAQKRSEPDPACENASKIIEEMKR